MKHKIYKRAEKQLSPQDAKTLNKEVDKMIIEQDEHLEYKHPVDVFASYYEAVETEVIDEGWKSNDKSGHFNFALT